MPKTKKKDSFFLDDRPSRFLINLRTEEEAETPSKKLKKASSFFHSEKEKVEYTQPTPRLTWKEKLERLVLFSGLKFLQKSLFSIGAAVVWGLKNVLKILFSPARLFSLFKKSKSKNKKTPVTKKGFFSRSLFGFVIVLMVLVLPLKGLTYLKKVYELKGRVLGASEEAATDLKGAAGQAANLNFDQATQEFSNASNKFLNAKDEIKVISKILSVIGAVVPAKDLQLAKNADAILDAGRLSADIGSHLSAAFSTLGEEPKNIQTIFNSFYFHTRIASGYAVELENKIQGIEADNLPLEYQADFASLKEKAGLVTQSLNEMADFLDHMKIFLGFDYDKRYLLVFQNNTELRASGGFLGSYALVDFRNGEITNLEVPGGGSYDTEAGLRRQVIAPEALHLVNPLWHFWDANWWPDWPTTAQKLMWFYEESDGPTVDGVISFTPTILERILKVIGPIDMREKYGVVITADNFWLETQRIAEEKPDPLAVASTSPQIIRHEPKKIIGDLMQKIIEVLPSRLNRDTFVALAETLEGSLEEKHVLFYFKDQDLEQKATEYGWDGEQKNTAWDYLMVVNTNVAGGKTDRVIRETISHKAEVQWDGSIIDTVTIKREHTGEKSQEFTGVRNNDWLRVYVPYGSELVSALGFSSLDENLFEQPGDNWEVDSTVAQTEGNARVDIESGTKIYTENNKTVFANWSQIDPGQTAVITLKYRLPFRLEKPEKEEDLLEQVGDLLNPNQTDLIPYALLIQKQPGSPGSNFSSVLNLHPNFQSVWQYPKDVAVNSTGWDFKGKLTTDEFLAVMLKANEAVLY